MEKNALILNSKIKRIGMLMLMSLLVLFAGVLSACDTGANNLKLAPSQEEVVLYLNSEENEASVSVFASGAKDDVLKDLYISSLSSSVKILNQQYVGNGQTKFSLVGKVQDNNATVTIQSKRNLKKMTEIKVRVIDPVVSLSRINTPYKNFVLKGSSVVLDNSLIKFNPSHTFENKLLFSIKDNPLPEEIKIEDNKLIVSKNIPQEIKTIEIVASSPHRDIAGVTLEYYILDEIEKQDITLLNVFSNKDLKQENSVIYLARNDGDFPNEKINLKVNTDQTLDVTAIVVDEFGNKQSLSSSFVEIANQTYDLSTKTYTFEIAPGKTAGKGYIYFEIEYNQFGYKYSTLPYKTKLLSYDIIKDILINNNRAELTQTYEIFSEYAEGFSGHEFVFDALPITVADEYKNFHIETNDYLPQNLSSSKILIYTKNSATNNLELLQLTDGKLKIESGEPVFIFANENSSHKTASIHVISEFSASFYEGTKKEQSAELQFNIINGVATAQAYGFLPEQNQQITLNSEEIDQQKFYFAVSNENAELLNHTTFKVEGNFAVVSNSLEKETSINFNEPNKALWSVTLTSLADSITSTGRLTINFGNGRSLRVDVVTALQFNKDLLKVSSQKAYENSAVGYYENNKNYIIDFYTAIKQGTSAKLLHNLDEELFDIAYSYYNAEFSSDEQSLYQDILDFNSDDLASSQFVLNSTIIKNDDLKNYNLISAKEVGRVLVKAVYSGKKFAESGMYQVLTDLEASEKVVKYFLVEVYVPIVNFDARISNNLLYSSNTVGYYNRNLSQGTITVSLNYGYHLPPTYNLVTYSLNALSNSQVRIEQSQSNPNNYIVTALSATEEGQELSGTEYRDGVIEFEVTELGQRKVVRIPIVIRNAEKVSDIILENVNQEEGIYLHVDRDSSFKVNARAENLTAYNTNFVYIFEADIGVQNPNDILTINENTGLINLKPNKIGGTGVIKIIPQDAFIVNELGQRELSSTNKVAKVVKIVIADGKSKATATRISDLSEISSNLNNHYVLDANISLNNTWTSITNFSGGLYGRLNLEQDMAQITFNNSSAIFDVLLAGAIVEDLILVGDINNASRGFVANVNNGTINNITIDTNTINDYSASVLNSTSTNSVGGIVGANNANGIVKNSNFFGKIVATNASYVGGIAGENKGLIENSKVEFYTFKENQNNDNFGGIVASGATVGGLVGNLDGGKIVLSYVYSYHNKPALLGSNIGALVGEVNNASSQISKSFSRTNAPYFVGGNYNASDHTASFNITNSYQFYYEPIENEEETLNEIYRVVGPNKQVFANGVKYNFGNTEFVPTYANYGIIFGTSASAWTYNLSNNKAYPYLKELLNEQISLNLNLNLISNENLLIDNENKQAVFYFYQPIGGVVGLTSQEQTTIKNWNTYSFAKLFGVSNSNGIKATVTREDGTVANEIKMHSNSFELLSTIYNLNLAVFSKYDYTTKVEFKISIIYAPGKLALTLDNNPVLSDSIIKVKGGTQQVLSANFESQKVVTTRLINFMQNTKLASNLETQTNLEQGNLIINPTSNIHVIDTMQFDGESFISFNAFATLENLEANFDYINALLKQTSLIRFSLSTYKGPFEISTNVKEIIRAMPYDVIRFEVEVITDNSNEKLELIITDETTSKISVWKDESGNFIEYNDLFMPQLSNILSIDSENIGNGKFKNTYQITLEIQDAYKNLNFDNIFLFVEIKAQDFEGISTFVDIIIASQEIQYINVFTQELDRYTTEDGFMFKNEISNNIAPGKNALITLDLFPKLAYFNTIEITSSVVNGQKISFSMLEYTNNKFTRMQGGFKAVTNGISVNQSVLQADNSNQKHLSTLYIYATVPSNVALETTFTLFVTAYGENKEFLGSSEFIIVAKPLISANITVNGGSSAVVAKGTSADIKVEMNQDQWLGNDGFLDLFVNNIPALGTDAYFENISITKPEEEFDESTNKRIYTARVEVSELAQFFNSEHTVDVIATVQRRVGNLTETVTSSVKIYVVDFLIDFQTFKVKTDSLNQNQLETNIGVSRNLEFDVNTTTWNRKGNEFPEVNDAIDQLEAKVALFKEKNHFFWQDALNQNSKYILNYHPNNEIKNNDFFKNYLNNLYYINSNGTTTKVLSSNGNIINSDIISFTFSEGGGIGSANRLGKNLRVEGKRTGTQNLRLVFEILNPDGSRQNFYYDFAVVVTPLTDEDKPEQIYSAEEFMAIANEEIAQDYILMEDIYLYEYVPFNTSKIKSFDGNNKVISIMSFDLDLEPNSSSISLGLFSVVTEITTLKNITVNYYHLNKILINTAKFKTISIAGLAIENRGIITNTHVLAYKFNSNFPNSPKTNLGLEVVYSSGSTETKISQNISSLIAGFVITNSGGGSITNSRVGGTDFTTVQPIQSITHEHSLRTFNISGQGSLAGFVHTNSGAISASFAGNINLENQSDIKRETITAGFVGVNNGKITLSYSKGAYNTLYPNEIRTSGSGISTTGIAAGFVYTNNGNISDSYSNIMIRDKNGNAGRGSAGFVYHNTSTGLIEKAYTASLTEDRNSSQMNFTGVDENLKILNDAGGQILNSYYYSPQTTGEESSTEIEELYASGVLKITSFTNLEAFYGFSFATPNSNDGVWKVTPGKGIDLVSANEIAISSRRLDVKDDDFQFVYAGDYRYGTKENPIIIRTAEEFNNVMGNEKVSTPIKDRFSLQNQTISGAYRLVADINLSQLSTTSDGDYKLASNGMSFVNGAMFDGNNLTISNLQMYSTLDYNKKSIGLFASIENGSIVKNLNVELLTIEANNVENVGGITGSLIDSKLVNINLSAVFPDISAKILGQNVVGGIVGLVSGNSAVVGLKTENISVEVDFYNKNIERQHFLRKALLNDFDHSKLSYAGGIIGILDLFTTDSFTQPEYFKEKLLSFANSASLYVRGYNEIKAGTAGGVIGLVGINTFVRDANYEIYAENLNRAQKIVAFEYAAGGVIGELNGALTQSKIEHNQSLQTQIEENLATYYTTSQNITRGNMTLFKNNTTSYSPKFVGGLVGKMGSGEISNSYSKANVVLDTAKFVGGVIGATGDYVYSNLASIKRIGNIHLEEIYSFGDIKSRASISEENPSGAGGLIGFIEYLEPNAKASNNMPIRFIINGSNAIIYHSKNVENLLKEDNQTLKDVYDFYAYTKLAGSFVASSDYFAKFNENLNWEINDIVSLIEFGSENQQQTYTSYAYTTKEFKVGENTYYLNKSAFGATLNESNEKVANTIQGKVANLNEIANLIADARVMDVIFRNNYWNEFKWERKTETLLPKIVFTVTSSIFYIEKPEDFLLMRNNPDKIFIIIGGDLHDGRRLIDMTDFDLGDAIEGFSGILKGYVEEEEGQSLTEIKEPKYGVINLNIEKALVASTRNGAVFSDLYISQSGSNNSLDGSILVKKATGTIFRNIYIENSSLETNSSSAGLLVAEAHDSIFDIINVSSNLPRNMVSVNINDASARRNTEDAITTFSAGVIVGNVSSSNKTTFKNIEIQARNFDYGIKVSGRTSSQNNSGTDQVENVYIGGIYGSATQNVEIISETQKHDFINLLKLHFNSGQKTDTGLIKDNYVLNIGAIGGRSTGIVTFKSANIRRSVKAIIHAEGSFKSINSTYVSAAVGGLFGHVSNINIQKNENDTSRVISNVEIEVENIIDESQMNKDNQPILSVGGAVGYASSSVILSNVSYGEEKISRYVGSNNAVRTIKVTSNNNNVYLGGLIGKSMLDTIIKNANVPSGIELKSINTKNDSNLKSTAVVGGILGENSFNLEVIIASLNLEKSVFNGLITLNNTDNVTVGGLVGGMNRAKSEEASSIYPSSIQANKFGGQIDMGRTTKGQIIAGGILGSSANGINDENKAEVSFKVDVRDNISYGDVNLSNDYMGEDYVVLGGIVAEGSAGLKVLSNISLTTLFSTRTSSGKFHSNAIVGNGEFSPSSDNSNIYSSQVNLATDKIGENLSYDDVLSDKISGIKNIMDELITAGYNEGNNDASLGYKLNPYKLVQNPTKNEEVGFNSINNKGQNALYRTYFIIKDNIENFTTNAITLEVDNLNSIYKQNQAFIGNGVKIKINNNQGRMFNQIDDKTFVSGISIKLDSSYYPETFEYSYLYEKNNEPHTEKYPYDIYGGLTAVNQGVVFAVNLQGSGNFDDGKNFYSEIFLSKTTLAGGLVGLNQGYIADSFTSVNLVNVTDVSAKINETNLDSQGLINNGLNNISLNQNELKIRPITSGFVGINEGDINSSYSSGVISAYNSIVYAFGADVINFNNSNNIQHLPTVKNSYTITQASNAYTGIEVDYNNKKATETLYANVFGTGADNSNFYDIYATQVKDNNSSAQRFITNQINEMINSENIKKFDINKDKSFGYPGFNVVYKEFDYMKQDTGKKDASGLNILNATVPNLGVLQKIISDERDETSLLTLHLINDMSVTSDMGFVSYKNKEFEKIDSSGSNKNSNWEPLQLNKVEIQGHQHKISDFIIYSNEKGSLGFFTEINNSIIEKLVLANSEVVSDFSSQDAYAKVGGFAGKITNSTIAKSTNLGVRVQSNKGGYVGGFVGIASTNSFLTHNINTGNVVAQANETTKTTTINGKTYSAFAGGIFGYLEGNAENINSNTNYAENINNNTNYGLIFSQMPEMENEAYAYNTFSAGIGVTNQENSSGQNEVKNINNGLAKVYSSNQDISSNGFTDNLIKGVNSTEFSENIIKTDTVKTPIGEGTKESPFIISSISEFNYAYTNFTATGELNIVLNTNINLEETMVGAQGSQKIILHSSSSNQQINLFGNNKLLSYKVNETQNTLSGFSLFKTINEQSQILNLNILGYYEATYKDVSLLSQTNNGTIKQTNVYGSILSDEDEKQVEKDSGIISGITIHNDENGRIELSNNYSLIQALSGEDAYLKEEKPTSAINGVNIGGIAGKTNGKIINSINFGALIGGNGGDGYSYEEKAESGNPEKEKKGEDGKNGTHGGHASVIGGIVYNFDDEIFEALVIGTNQGIIIGGHGGNGGKGQEGGDGSNALSDYTSYLEGLKNAYITGSVYGNIVDLFKKNAPNGANGGAGGAGGNGGNSIASGVIGLSNSNNYNIVEKNTNLMNTIIAGTPGIGGNGGNGGNGGKGRYTTAWHAFITAGYGGKTVEYGHVGNGGGAGGSGYWGNSIEVFENQFILKDEINIATAGNGQFGGNGSSGVQPNGISGKSKEKKLLGANSITLLNVLVAYQPYIAAANDRANGGKAKPAYNTSISIQSILGHSIKLPDLMIEPGTSIGYYEISSWSELLNILYASVVNETDFSSREYRLMDNFQFGDMENASSLFFNSLPQYYGTINGMGKSLTIQGSYTNLQLLSSKPDGNQNKLKNLNLNLNITNFDDALSGSSQFIAPGYTFSDYVTVTGSVSSEKTIPILKLLYGTVNTDENSLGGLQFKPKYAELTGSGIFNDEYIINSEDAFEEFVELANLGSDSHFKLTKNITLTPSSENDTYLIDSFRGQLNGNNKTIKLDAVKHDEEINYHSAYYGLFRIVEENAKISNLKIEGYFNTASIAETNYGTIQNIVVGNNGELIETDFGDIAGIVADNMGIIDNVVNNISFTSNNGNASGIVIINNGLINNAVNNGAIISGSGKDGQLYENISEIDKALYEEAFENQEQEFNEFKINLLNGGDGFDAAGIAIYNYIEQDDSSEEDYFENGILKYGITNARNDGDIIAGKGGEGIEGGSQGLSGRAAGIVVYNIVETRVAVDLEAENPEMEDVIYRGYIFTQKDNGGNDNVINNGEIYEYNENGNLEMIIDEKRQIVAVNEIIIDNEGEPEILEGYLDGFSWLEEEDDD